MRKKITQDELALIVDAGKTLCEFCDDDACEYCKVTLLLNDAFNECPDAED